MMWKVMQSESEIKPKKVVRGSNNQHVIIKGELK